MLSVIFSMRLYQSEDVTMHTTACIRILLTGRCAEGVRVRVDPGSGDFLGRGFFVVRCRRQQHVDRSRRRLLLAERQHHQRLFLYTHSSRPTSVLLLLLLPPPKEVMSSVRSVCLFVCLFVCPSDNWKSYERILTKFLGGVGPMDQWVQFCLRSGFRSPRSEICIHWIIIIDKVTNGF